MCMQLAARVGPKELEEFFQQVGQVREVKMISDRNSRRSKGIAYVEFHDENSVPVVRLQTDVQVYLLHVTLELHHPNVCIAILNGAHHLSS